MMLSLEFQDLLRLTGNLNSFECYLRQNCVPSLTSVTSALEGAAFFWIPLLYL